MDIWGIPAVNTDLMRQQMLTKTSDKVGEVIYWGRCSWSNEPTYGTGNPDPTAEAEFKGFDTGIYQPQP